MRLFLAGQQQVGWVPPPRGHVSFPRVAPAAACAGNTPAFSRYLLTRNLKSHPSHSFRLMQSSAHLPVAAFYNAAAGSALLHILIAWHTRMLRAPHTPKQQNPYTCVSIFIIFFHPTYTAPSTQWRCAANGPRFASFCCACTLLAATTCVWSAL